MRAKQAARRPWDRRRDETPRAYALFVRYRDMGPVRSLRKLVAEDETATKLRQIPTYSARYDWPGRAGAWDDHLQHERAMEAVVEAREMARQHVVVAKAALLKSAEKIQQIDAAKLTVREAVLLAQFAIATERAARRSPSEVIVPREAERRASGADILQTLREAPDLLDLARAIDERLDAAEADD